MGVGGSWVDEFGNPWDTLVCVQGGCSPAAAAAHLCCRRRPLCLQVLLRLFPQPAFRNIALQCLAEVRLKRGACTKTYSALGLAALTLPLIHTPFVHMAASPCLTPPPPPPTDCRAASGPRVRRSLCQPVQVLRGAAGGAAAGGHQHPRGLPRRQRRGPGLCAEPGALSHCLLPGAPQVRSSAEDSRWRGVCLPPAHPPLPTLPPAAHLPLLASRTPCSVLETSDELRAALIQGLDTLVAISYVDDDEVWLRQRRRRRQCAVCCVLCAAGVDLRVCIERFRASCFAGPHCSTPCSAPQVFKICLEYWNFFVPDVYSTVVCSSSGGASSGGGGMAGAAAAGLGGLAGGGVAGVAPSSTAQQQQQVSMNWQKFMRSPWQLLGRDALGSAWLRLLAFLPPRSNSLGLPPPVPPCMRAVLLWGPSAGNPWQQHSRRRWW